MGTCKFIWAKSSQNTNDESWLSLDTHLHDTMMVSEYLWSEWVPEHTRSIITSGISGCEYAAVNILKFLSATHDIGKATPAFQRKNLINNPNLHKNFIDNLKNAGLKCNNVLTDANRLPHYLLSEIILERNDVPRDIAVIIGSHHGLTPTKRDLDDFHIDSYCAHTGFEDCEWVKIQDSLFSYASDISNINPKNLKNVRISQQSQILMSSLVIMSDWIASNNQWFPLIADKDLTQHELEQRASNGWRHANVPRTWRTSPYDPSSIFSERFDHEPRPFQKKLIEIVSEMNDSGIIVVEAPMGEGKTEAALAAAEILSNKLGMGGVFFALPTQATANGIFPRIKRWVDLTTDNSNDTNSIFLAHGKSKFNKEYTSIKHIGWNESTTDSDGTVIHEWFTGKKKGLLSDFAIGTVDHVLMGGLKLKHLALRHLGLANKVVIIDECHAYDTYMGNFLVKIVEWLGSYHVPIIIMSATLYPSRRKELITAYLGKRTKNVENQEWGASTQYPVITITDGDNVKQYVCESSKKPTNVSIVRIKYSELYDAIGKSSTNGGYIGIFCNTVTKSQDVFNRIRELYPNDKTYLLHSKFINTDRSKKESDIITMISKEYRKCPPFRTFVVGTQVIEQSLDLDFDVIFSELCPIDLLLQRIGRLHRHENIRPAGLENPMCYVIDDGDRFDEGSEFVYGRYQLYNARLLMSDKVVIPTDIPKLVHSAYSNKPLDIHEGALEDYLESFRDMNNTKLCKENNAKTFQIREPWKGENMVDWLKGNAQDDSAGNMAMATVRDTDESIEAILVVDNGDSTISPISDGALIKLNTNESIDEDVAFLLAGCKITLPRQFAGKKLGSTLSELSDITSKHIPMSWRSNGWLKDELFLITGSDGTMVLNGIRMRYSSEEGLVVLK